MALKANQALINLLSSIARKEEGVPCLDCARMAAGPESDPGTTKLHRLEENIGAVPVELTLDDLRDIDTATSKIAVEGARYPEKLRR